MEGDCCSCGASSVHRYAEDQPAVVGRGPNASNQPPVILLDAKDNVATALTNLLAGTKVVVGDREVAVASDIPFAHKFALEDIGVGQPVVKYGEVIGLAKAPIARGDHVHRHNVDHRVEEIIFRMRKRQ